MNTTQREALESIITSARKYGAILNQKKRMTQQEVWDNAVLYRDIVTIENYVTELKQADKKQVHFLAANQFDNFNDIQKNTGEITTQIVHGYMQHQVAGKKRKIYTNRFFEAKNNATRKIERYYSICANPKLKGKFYDGLTGVLNQWDK